MSSTHDPQPSTEPQESRVVLLTGASSGIGWASAKLLAARGFRLVLVARRAERLEQLVEEITQDTGQAIALPGDVTDPNAMPAAVRVAEERWGQVDVLVNNAGIMPLSPLSQGRIDDWTRMVDVNIKGPLHALAAVLPGMLERHGGHIVNVGSVAGRRPFPGGTVYSATKFAVRSLSAGIQLELSAERGIRVTDIEPGVVRTELMDHIPDDEVRKRFADTWEERAPLEPSDVAEAIRFALEAPDRVNINEILIRPTHQAT